MRVFLAAGVLAAFLTPFSSSAEGCCDGASGSPYIAVIGRAELRIEPDYVDFSFGATTEGEKLSDVRAENQSVIDALLESLDKAGVKKRDVQTTQLRIARTVERDKNRNVVRYTGFSLSRSVNVRLRDFDISERVVQAAIDAGANDVRQNGFGSSKIQEEKAKVRLMAVNAAKKKAADMAGELGSELGLPRSIVEEGRECSTYSRGLAVSNVAGFVSSDGESSASVLMPGELTIMASVCVDFALK